jgi:catechol 2,3-dioxygenase-like lactoylglutathione lyase family enzyme
MTAPSRDIQVEHVNHPTLTWLQLPSGVMLHLIESQDATARPENVHHAFEVEDFDASVQALEGKGIPVERSGVRHDGRRYLFIRDPDGNRVELCAPSGF